MDYNRVYEEFIADRLFKHGDRTHQQKGREIHHIFPRSLGGENNRDNLISLTYSDHLFAHLLLAKTYRGKLASAFTLMKGYSRYKGRHTRHEYASIKADAILHWGAHHPNTIAASSRKGKNRSAAQRAATVQWVQASVDARKGKPIHENTKAAVGRQGAERSAAQQEGDRKQAEALRGIKRPAYVVDAMQKGRAATGYKRSPTTEEAAKNISAAKKGVPWTAAQRDASARAVEKCKARTDFLNNLEITL